MKQQKRKMPVRTVAKAQPVDVWQVNRGVWLAALDLSENNPKLIKIVSATRVVVGDPRYERAKS